MPRPHSTKAKDEHLIFIKNVPAELAIGSLLELLERYGPSRVKNVYPNSDITTIVVSFRTFDEASYAKEDTDGMRLDNVVLRVEMFSKHRSVRYLRDERNAPRPLGVVDEGYEEEINDQAQYILKVPEALHLNPSHVPVVQDKSASTTWAQVATNLQRLDQPPLPSCDASPPLPPIAPEQVAISTPELSVVTTRFSSVHKTDEALLEQANNDNNSPTIFATCSTAPTSYDGDVNDNCKPKHQSPSSSPKMTRAPGITAPWEPIYSTDNIRLRHCRKCTLCQMRLRLRG